MVLNLVVGSGQVSLTSSIQIPHRNSKSQNALPQTCTFHRSCLCFEACRFTRPHIRDKGNRRIPKKFKVISNSLILLSRSQLSTGHDKRKSRTSEDRQVFSDLKHSAYLRWILPSCSSLQSLAVHNYLLSFCFPLETSLVCAAVSIQYNNAYCGCKIA